MRTDGNRIGRGLSGSLSQPTIRGVAVTDLSALVGALLWLGATAGGELDAITRALALAPLVLVPLGMSLAATPGFSGVSGRLYRVVAAFQPIGAALLLYSLLLPERTTAAALAAIPWLLVTGLLALVGLTRLLERGRGLRPFSETSIDVGFAYSTVGAVALILYHLEIFFWFSPVIILLTAVHFHYAGFVLLVLTGITGRCVSPDDRLFRGLVSIILVGPAIIAVGISFSATVELIAVSVFTVTVTALGGYILLRVVPRRPRLQGALIAASALTLPLSMTLALGFVLATVVGFDPWGLSIPRMVSLHGTLNAFGFALLGIVGWWLAVPRWDG